MTVRITVPGDKLTPPLGLLFDPEEGSDLFLRNVGLSPKYTALQPTRL
jgi:hypothetical protein